MLNSVGFSSVPVHWHEEMELIVVKKGRGIVTLDRESRVLEAGQAVIVLPGQLHSIRQYQQERMEYENIILDWKCFFRRKETYAVRDSLSLTVTESFFIRPGSMALLRTIRKWQPVSEGWMSSLSGGRRDILWR